MKKFILSLFALLCAVASVQAKYWKIGPSSVTGMDFSSLNAAMSSSNVAAGDTLYLDQNYNEGAEQTVTKKVVIIGTGYDTSFTDEGVVARLTSYLHLKANGIVVKSVRLSTVYFYNDDCILDRCYTSSISTKSSTAGMNHVYSCYVNASVNGYSDSSYSQYDIQNCVIKCNGTCISKLKSSIVSYNTIISTTSSSGYYCFESVGSSQITNNIILRTNNSYYNSDFASDVYSSGSGNTIEHNVLSHTSTLSYYPTNKIGYGGSSSELFTQAGEYSNYYKLAEKSAAKGYATDGGEVGAHGGMFGCPSGGRPQYIPYFTKVTVGSRTENGKLPVSVTIKIQDE